MHPTMIPCRQQFERGNVPNLPNFEPPPLQQEGRTGMCFFAILYLQNYPDFIPEFTNTDLEKVENGNLGDPLKIF